MFNNFYFIQLLHPVSQRNKPTDLSTFFFFFPPLQGAFVFILYNILFHFWMGNTGCELIPLSVQRLPTASFESFHLKGDAL